MNKHSRLRRAPLAALATGAAALLLSACGGAAAGGGGGGLHPVKGDQ